MTNNQTSCDWLFRDVMVVDGPGRDPYRADVSVRGDRIAAIAESGSLTESDATVVEGHGHALAPGFIDAHTHDDRAVLSDPQMSCKVSQGVTTVVTGNCGVSLAPWRGGDPVPPLNLLGDERQFAFRTMADYLTAVRESPMAVNVLPQVGHTTLRANVMEDLSRAATQAEINGMLPLLTEAMEAGCIGLSTGLAYPPANAAPTEEVIALAREASRYGAIHSTHMRDEKAHVTESVRETLTIGEAANISVVISHHKCSGRDNWGRSRETLDIIAKAQADMPAGRHIDLDVYPYTASSTVLLPEFVRTAERVLITWSHAEQGVAGCYLDELCAEWGCELAEAIERLQPAGAIYFQMDEADLQRIIKYPTSMIGSDGIPHDEHPHPRLWGTFPRVLGHYARELGLLSVAEAIHKMSGRTAEVFGLSDRGLVAVGNYADLVLFNPETIIDDASFDEPTRPARGVDLVMVNGEPVWRNGQPTGRGPGRLLLRPNGMS